MADKIVVPSLEEISEQIKQCRDWMRELTKLHRLALAASKVKKLADAIQQEINKRKGTS